MTPTNKNHSLSLQKALGILVIVSILTGSWLYLSIILKGQQPYYRDYDPEMSYFMNSLAPFEGAPYFYTDHPGTPVEVVGTLLLGTTYVFFKDHPSFIYYYLRNPELFLNLAHVFVTLLSILCAVYFFLTAYRTLRGANVLVALSLALLFYGLHPYSFTTLTVWSHTSFNFPLGTWYLILLFNVAHDNQRQISNRFAVGLGLALGVMIAVMINFVPWLITTLIFIVFSNYRKGIAWQRSLTTSCIVLLSCTAGFLVSTLPAIERIPYFFGFIYKLFNHQLPYGNGPEGITSIPFLFSNLTSMVGATPWMFFMMLAGLLTSLFIFRQRDSHISQNDSMWILSFCLLLQCGIITLAVLKHPGERFLLPLAATLPVLLLTIIKLSDFNRKVQWQLSNMLVIFSVISISVLAVLSIRNRKVELLETRAIEAEISRAIAEQEKRLNKEQGELLIMRTNMTYSYCSARLYGDFFTAGVFATEINALCPSQVYFFYHYNWVLYQGTQMMVDDLPWDILVTPPQLLAGNPSWQEKGKVYKYTDDVFLVVNER